MPSTPVIAVLGLGAMGLPMASRLAERFTVRGYDIDPGRSALAAGAGVAPGASAREVAGGADVVLLAVRNRTQLEDALYGADGVVAVLAPGALVTLTSTVGIDAVRDVAARLADEGVHLVDAPISGGPVRAGQGDLLITVGATDEAFAAAEPVLAHLASRLTRVGPRPGDGQAMKTVNQLLCGVHIAAGAEVRSRLDIFVKDMGIVGSAARSVGLATPVAAAAEQLFLLGLAAGLAAADDSAVITVVAPRPT